MKCLKHKKTSNIIRVSDLQAYQMAGREWSYVPKSEWKSQEGKLITKKEDNAITNKEGI